MKKILTLFILAIGLFLVAGCNPENTVNITVKDRDIEVELGDVYVVNPQISGLNMTPELAYTSTNPSVFEVDESGIITPKATGIAYLWVDLLNANSGAPRIKITVSIVDPANPEDKEIDKDVPPKEKEEEEEIVTLLIANGDLNIEVDDVVYLEVLANGSEYLGEIIWVSSNQGVATLDINGSLIAKAAGTTVVSAVAGGSFTTINVEVRQKQVSEVLPTIIEISGTSFVNEEGVVVLFATPDVSVNSNIIWESNNESVATVNNFGVVTGVSSGVVVISASLEDYPSVTGSFTLLVKEVATSASPIESITITGQADVLQSAKIKLNVSYTPAEEVATFTFSSSNEAVATVDNNGWVTGVAGGSVQIIASLVGDMSKNASFNVKVLPLPSEVILTGSSTVSIGQSVVLQATVLPSGAATMVNWSTSNSSIASVDSNGRVTGITGGDAVITATSITSDSVKGTFNITVTDQRSITLSPTSLNLVAGTAQTISATVFAASLTDKTVVWTSGNTAVATVDNSGKVTAISAGSATIIAKLNADNSVQAQITVTVTAAAKPTITISAASATLLVGATKTLTATVSNATNTAVTWTSSNASIATVVNGVVTAKAAGTATITVTSAADTSVKATSAITVTAPPAGTLTVTQSPTGSIAVGAEGYTLYVDDSSGTAVSRLECTFVSANASIATVSAYGTVSALKAGSVKITVNHPQKGTGSITLTIGGGTTPPPVTPPAGTLTITADPSASIKVGASGYQLYVRDSSNTAVSRTECTFTSSASTVATVSTFGTISALKAGTAKITVSHSKGTGTITLTVTATTVTPPVTPPAGSMPATLKTAFALVDKYRISTTFSRYVRTYGNTVKTATVLGSVNYLKFGGSSVNTTKYYRWHSTAPGRKYITIHCTGNNSNGANAAMNARFLQNSSGASIHYCIDSGSTIYRVCPENSTAWHAGSTTSGLSSGNSYAIGIEMCVNPESRLWEVWQRTAGFLPLIMSRWSGLSYLSCVKQHYSFSYKNCPQELRQAGLWTGTFSKMVQAEYEWYYKFQKKGYGISGKSLNTTYVDNTGQVIRRPGSNLSVGYQVTITKSGVSYTKTYTSTIPSSVGAAVTGRNDWSTISTP